MQASYGDATNGHAVAIGGAVPASGRSDTSFGNGGVTLLDLGSDRSSFCHALAPQPDGKAVIAGSSVRAGVGLAVVRLLN